MNSNTPEPRPRTKPDPRMPAKWTPKFLDEMDSRLSLVRKLRQRADAIATEVQADTSLKRLLVDRLGFIVIMLETLESDALINGRLQADDAGRWVQAVNSLQGLARLLGVERKAAKVGGLQAYLASKKRNVG